MTRVLVSAVRRFELRQQDFIAVIDGMQMDAESVIVAPDLATLDLYRDRVAAAVGRLSVRAFGDASPAADLVARALGRALQLTNILRDLREDAERGRLYLPLEYLQAAGVPLEPDAALASPGLGAVCGRVAALAHGYFAEAQAAMAACNRRAMKTGPADGRDGRGDPRAPGAAGVVSAGRAGGAGRVAEAVAGGALRGAGAARPECRAGRIGCGSARRDSSGRGSRGGGPSGLGPMRRRGGGWHMLHSYATGEDRCTSPVAADASPTVWGCDSGGEFDW